ncbi:MAG TPA: tetratricopeptide repeat protein [Candidatus Binatia bacterium]|nr:tetratricopeptide repeat protein [Candidatus Binatia bacterium]
MSEATKRLRRKDLRQPDEFVTLTGQVAEWARENSRAVAIAASAVAVLLIAFGLWSWVAQSRAARAARDFYAADELFKRDQWDQAEKGFVELADALPSTPYGRLARLYAGRAALRGGRSAEAVGHLQAFLASPVSDPAIEQLARMNLGVALAAQGQLDTARQELSRAVEMDGPARGESILELARVEEAAGQNDKALEDYQRYLSDDPNAVARDLARTRILALGGTPPAVAPPSFPGGGAPQIAVQ